MSDGVQRNRVQHGDWQTPLALAQQIVSLIQQNAPGAAHRSHSSAERGADRAASVIEPSCGRGAFLEAAVSAFPGAVALGFDISEAHVDVARERLARLGNHCARVEVGDFFRLQWEEIIARLPEPILVLGNPPWVTNSVLGSLGVKNLPPKRNFKKHSGLDALTGKSNFDISESMILRLLDALQGRRWTLAMLCKASVARRVMEHLASCGRSPRGELRAIDSREHFDAAVDAVLLWLQSEPAERGAEPSEPSGEAERELRWDVHVSLDSTRPERQMGIVERRACSDVEMYRATSHLASTHLAASNLAGGNLAGGNLAGGNLAGSASGQLPAAAPPWRSGVKHDCAKVMELRVSERGLINGFDQVVQLEPDFLFPLLKGSELARGCSTARRVVIVTQRHLADDTSSLRSEAPATWRYLEQHRSAFEARKSRIYRGKPPFALFGIGPYSFAPYKVAICGLYKRFVFTRLCPIEGKPVMVDDTAYFLPCSSEREATRLTHALNGSVAREFFGARVFWDAKRPISKALLQSLSLEALLGSHPAGQRLESTNGPESS